MSDTRHPLSRVGQMFTDHGEHLVEFLQRDDIGDQYTATDVPLPQSLMVSMFGVHFGITSKCQTYKVTVNMPWACYNKWLAELGQVVELQGIVNDLNSAFAEHGIQIDEHKLLDQNSDDPNIVITLKMSTLRRCV